MTPHRTISLLDLGFIYWWCRRQNRLKESMRAEPTYIRLQNQQFMDLTDQENLEFIYTL